MGLDLPGYLKIDKYSQILKKAGVSLDVFQDFIDYVDEHDIIFEKQRQYQPIPVFCKIWRTSNNGE